MQISYFPRVQETRPVVRKARWPDEFLQWYEAKSDDESEKTKIPLFTCSLFREGAERAKGSSAAGIEAVSGLVLDYDTKHAVRITDVESVWAGYDFVIYTTFRHGVDVSSDRFRVLVPFAEALPVADYLRFLEGFAKPFSEKRGVSLETLSVGHAGFFYPTRRPDAEHFAKHYPGVRLDAKAILSELPPVAANSVHVLRTVPVVAPPPPVVDNAGAEPVRSDVFRGIEKAHEIADLGLLESHCAFLRHGRENAAKISEPEWRSWLSITIRCKNGREQAHAISSAYKGYSASETEQKIERLLTEAGPHSCEHIAQNFSGCGGCPLRGKLNGPLAIQRIVDRTKSSSTEEIAAAADVIQRSVTYEERVEETRRRLTGARTKEAEAQIALSVRRKMARAAPKVGALEGEDPEVVAATIALTLAKEQVKQIAKELRDAERAASRFSLLDGANPETYDLLVKEYGTPKSHMHNIDVVFTTDPAYKNAFTFDIFKQKTCYEGKQIEAVAETVIRIDLNRRYDIDNSDVTIRRVINKCAFSHQFHPVRDYLRAQTWDGVSRLDDLMGKGFGCLPSMSQDPAYLADVGRKLCISAVARVMDPKAKNEVIVIAQGKQGKGKSTAFAALCPNSEWHSDTPLKMHDKDAYMMIQGKWIFELAELSTLKKSEQEAIKAFISSMCDNFRPPYSADTVNVYRNTVFVATTNDDQFIDDPTGDRRYAPVTSGNIDLGWIRANGNQLWAEALVRYDRGEPWWYIGIEEERRARACRPFRVEDVWTDTVLHKIFAGEMDGFYTVDRMLTRWLNVPTERISKSEKNRLTRVMTQLGIPYVRLQQMKVALEQGYTFAPRGFWINNDTRKLLTEEYAPNVVAFPERQRADEVF